MFENLFRNVASMAYLVGVLLAAAVSSSIGIMVGHEMHATLAQAAFVLLVCLLGFMTARSAGETFGTAVDLHWTKVALADIAAKSKSGPAQDDGNTPPTT